MFKLKFETKKKYISMNLNLIKYNVIEVIKTARLLKIYKNVFSF